MNTYIHRNILETSKHFIDKFTTLQVPPRFRTKKNDIIFFKQLEYNYTLLLDFCCSKKLLNTTPQHKETIYTKSGSMSYSDQEWKVKISGRENSPTPKALLKIQNKLEQLLQTSLHPSTDTYQVFDFQLRGGLAETHVLGVCYKDSKDKIIFYLFDCVFNINTLLEQQRTTCYQENLKSCTTILKALIDKKEAEEYESIYTFSKEIEMRYEDITDLFKQCYNNTLFDQYKTQRLLHALYLLLYSPYRFKRIKRECHYSAYQVFQRDFKKDYISPQAVRNKVTAYTQELFIKYK